MLVVFIYSLKRRMRLVDSADSMEILLAGLEEITQFACFFGGKHCRPCHL